jgi:hypothetical protein
MNWSAYVLGLIDQGYSTEDIVTLADNPYITDVYVKAVRLTQRKIYPFESRGPHKVKTSKVLMKIEAYAKEVGVKEFLKELDEVGSLVLGRKLGVPYRQILNYKARYINTPNGVTKFRRYHYRYEDRLIKEGKLEKPPESLTLEEMKKLW